MSKFALAIVVLALIAFAADQHFFNGRYTDDMVLTLQRMRQAVGWWDMAHEAQASSSLKPALDKDSGARIDEIEGSGLTWRALAKKIGRTEPSSWPALASLGRLKEEGAPFRRWTPTNFVARRQVGSISAKAASSSGNSAPRRFRGALVNEISCVSFRENDGVLTHADAAPFVAYEGLLAGIREGAAALRLSPTPDKDSLFPILNWAKCEGNMSCRRVTRTL